MAITTVLYENGGKTHLPDCIYVTVAAVCHKGVGTAQETPSIAGVARGCSISLVRGIDLECSTIGTFRHYAIMISLRGSHAPLLRDILRHISLSFIFLPCTVLYMSPSILILHKIPQRRQYYTSNGSSLPYYHCRFCCPRPRVYIPLCWQTRPQLSSWYFTTVSLRLLKE